MQVKRWALTALLVLMTGTCTCISPGPTRSPPGTPPSNSPRHGRGDKAGNLYPEKQVKTGNTKYYG